VPLENERKYVLRDIEAALADLSNGAPYNSPGYYGRGEVVEQGYLPGDARIRRRWIGDSPGLAGAFTYKLKTPDGLVEIECMIEMVDFNRLWPLTRDRIRKRRFDFFWDDSGHWDIDFFLDDQDNFYFAMAECEMQGRQRNPKTIPPVLAPYIAYTVPTRRQTEFTNVRLANPEYARSLKW
jgi:hypothetical protein